MSPFARRLQQASHAATASVSTNSKIAQQNTGTWSGTTATITLPNPSAATSQLILIIAGNTVVTTPAGWTRREAQVNAMGHYLYTQDGGSTSSWNVTTAPGVGTWYLAELTNASYESSTSANAGSADTTYTTPTLTPSAGDRWLVASLASSNGYFRAITMSQWTNSFNEVADLQVLDADEPMQGVATRFALGADGVTGYSTSATYSDTTGARSAIIASFSVAYDGTDTVAPAPPEFTNKASSLEQSPTFTGTSEANATISLTIDGNTYTTAADGSGNWSIVIPVVLDIGSYPVMARATDANSNTSAAATQTMVIFQPGEIRTITHGIELTPQDVGPWALQGVSPGDEALQDVAGPSRGYWRFDAANEFVSSTAWPSDANDDNPEILNDPSLHLGKVTGSPVTIDGYTIPVGTYIVQFQNFLNVSFYADGDSTMKILYRGCRLRSDIGVAGGGIFNDSTSDINQQIMVHFCDIGLKSPDPPGGEGAMHMKFLGGSNHRILRNYHTYSGTFIQPNTAGVEITENYIDHILFPYGEGGPTGNFADAGHLNGISTEGVMTSITIQRNHILAPSPDGATGSTGSDLGEIGYGTQPGQVGYGAGTNPGRITGQTDNIALFTNNGDNIGDSNGLKVMDNYLGGTGYCIYAGGANAQNVTLTGNKVTTKWWTNGGSFGALAYEPAWGSNGNVKSNNTWADDYGDNGDGMTALADRQYPAGDGPRVGTTF